jgi:hypothetical protein
LNKKQKQLLNETLDKALAPPSVKRKSHLDGLMEEYAPEDPNPRTAHEFNLNTAESPNLRTATPPTPIRQPEPPAVQPYSDSTYVRPKGSTIQPYAGQIGKPNPEKVKVTVRMLKDNVLKFKELCFNLNIDLQDFLEDAAVRELNRRTAERSNEPSYGSTAHDDMMMFKTCEDIIMAYQKMTGNRWNRADDRVGLEFNQVDPRLVEIALAICLDRKLHGNTSRRPVKSFAYFVGEIQELVQQSDAKTLPSGIAEYHRYVLNKWETRIRPLRDKKWSTG